MHMSAQRASSADTGFAIDKNERSGLSIKLNGQPFADYVVDQANKPYLAPVFGPTGRQMTRNYPMKTVEGEQRDHPHHRGICFGNEGIAGVDTWIEQKTIEETGAKNPASVAAQRKRLGFIRHREYRELKADAREAVVVAVSDICNADGKKLLEEEHRMVFRADAATRTIDFDLDYIASEGPVKFEDKKDAGFSIRVPSEMAVEIEKNKKGTGHIINSEGQADADAWSKRAKWCDYHGTVGGEAVGVAMLNHPSSFRFPTLWHIRTYGLFTANPFGSRAFDKKAEDATFELEKGGRVKLRHRIIFHQGDEKQARIAEAYEAYAKEKK